MKFIYLDAESIPAQTEAGKARIAASVKAPGNISKAETIAAWEVDKKPQAIEDAIAKTSFDAVYGQVCCIGAAINDSAPVSFSALSPDDEKSTITHAFAELDAQIGYEQTSIVGHFITGFDLPFIMRRCMVLGIKIPVWFPINPKPWDDTVFDTMFRWAGAKGSISMDDLCFALGIEGKGDIDGSMVARMFARGEHEAIGAYCRSDVEKVRMIHRKMMAALGGAA